MAADKPLLLVDGSSYLFRAFYALPDLRTLDGFPTGAIRGVIGMLRKLANDYEGSPVAVVFDVGGKTFRNELYPEYKANRPKMADDLRLQIQPIFDIIEAMGMPLLRVPDVEADDVIGTLAAEATRTGRRTIISTGDKDMAQLVSGYVTLVNTMSDTTLDHDGVIEKYGVPPELIVDYLALMGDSVDNIPGVPKVGPKTAAKWLATYGSLDEVIAHSDAVKGKIGQNLRDSVDALPLSRELARIRCDVHFGTGIADLTPGSPDEDALREHFERYEFKPWLEELGGGTSEPVPTEALEVTVVLNRADLDALLGRAREAGRLTLSVETTPGRFMESEPVGVALGVAPGDAAYVPVGHDHLGAPAQLGWSEFLEAAGPVLEDAAVAKTGQDLKHASNILARFGIGLAGVGNDTMLESYVLDSVGARRHALEDVAKKYLGREAPTFEALAGKGAKQRPMNQVDVQEAADYAATRVDLATRLHETLRRGLDSTGRLAEVYDEIDRPLLTVLSRMERRGALVDAGLLAEQGRELAEGMEGLAERAFEAAGEAFNLGSPKQLQEILYDKLEMPALRKTQKGQRSTAEPVLQELASRGYELPAIILAHRSLSKLKSTYTDSLPHEINQRTGRIHTSYNQAVAATGRLSSADPNLQNIPIRTAEGRRIRQAFVASPGKKLLAADYSQIELRIMAHLSGDAGLLRAFEGGDDIHRATAAEVFGCALEAVSDDQRRSAKAINFGLIYGMSAFGLGQQLGVTRHVADEYITRYFQRYPQVHVFMERTRAQAGDDGFVETHFGRRLYLPEINDRNRVRRQAAERAAINAPMQGTAADIIKRAMVAVDAFCGDSDLDAAMIMQVHDELVLEVADEDVSETVAEVSARMRGAADLDVELVVDVGVGVNWDEAH
ncbi:MAG: DNA polymerase I [Gammaproteobacteria bacterium]|nr:DNA polymerase I [Gammaproteobacteria bacterium]